MKRLSGFLFSFLLFSFSIHSQNIVVIGDGSTEGTVEFILTNNGYSVTSVADLTLYNGSNPELTDIDVVIILDGDITVDEDMPSLGQDEILSFVQNGGGLITTSWIYYEVDNNSNLTTIAGLVPLGYTNATISQGPYNHTILSSTHPVTSGVADFSVMTHGNIGSAKPGGTVLVTAATLLDAVVVDDSQGGRVVSFASAGNYLGADPFTNASMEDLLLNAVLWCRYIPEPPSSLTATPMSGNHIQLQWSDHADNETNFVIERKLDPGTFVEITTLGPDVTSYDDIGLENNKTYDYRIKAVDAREESAYSNVASATTPVNEDPTDIELAGSTIQEKAPSNTVIGTFSTVDPDDVTHTYSLITETGGVDNAHFIISEDELRSNTVFNYEFPADADADNIYSIEVRTDDGNGGTRDEIFLIDITNTNDVPTDISIADNNVDENVSTGTVAGTLSTTDEDSGDSHTYTFVIGEGSDDNGAFTITGNNLETKVPINFESKSQYFIRLETNDGNGGLFQKALTINVNDIADSPTNINLSSNSLAENLAIGTTIGTLTSVDEDASETHTYQLVSGTGDVDNNQFTINGNQLRSASLFDFETKNSFAIRMETNDGNGNTHQKEFTITITDENDSPTDISLSSQSVTQNMPEGTTIGVISATDQDPDDIHTFIRASGTGDDDNASFGITGSQLVSAEVFDIDVKDSYTVRVQANDGNGGTFSKAFTITILKEPNSPPTDISLNNQVVAENTAIGHLAGTLTSADVDEDNIHTYSLVKGEGDDDNGSFSIAYDSLKTAVIFDFEQKSTYSVLVQSDDGSGGTFVKQFTISITDANDPPVNITLSNTQVEENQPSGTVVGSLSTEDQDEDTHTYTIISGSDNFAISGNQLLTNKVFSFANQTSSAVTIQSDDAYGGIFQKDFSISILQSTDTSAPILTGVSLPEFFVANGGAVTLSITATDNIGVDNVTFGYRKITAPGSTFETLALVKSGNTYSVEIDESLFDQIGLEYKWEAIDLSGNSNELTGEIHLGFSSESIESIPRLVFGGTQDSYQVISIPYVLSNNTISSVFDELGGFDKKRWRLLRHKSDGVSFDEFTKGLSRIDPGLGYWLNIKEQTTIEIGQRNTVPNTQDDPFEIVLVPGWNQIGNPYRFDVAWNDIVDFNGSPDDLGTFKVFNQGSFSNGSTLKSYGGGFVRWEGESNFQLKIPVAGTSSSGKSSRIARNKALDQERWRVPFTISVAGLSNTLSGFGMHPEASLSKDRYDDITVPRLFDFVELNFMHPEYKAPKFSYDVVPHSKEFVWEFETTTNLNEKVKLSWSNDYWGENGMKLILFDKTAQKIMDMRTQTTYTFQGSESRLFSIYFGSDEFIDRTLDPQQVVLGANFPNPFQRHTSIPFTLPPSQQDYKVHISVLDLNGRQVQVLVNQEIPGGFYEISWDGQTHSGMAARGIYLVHMEVKNNMISQRRVKKILKN